MKRIYILIVCILAHFLVTGQYRYGPGTKAGKLLPPLYTHLSDLPSTSTYPFICQITDSMASTQSHGLYVVDSLGVFPLTSISGGGGGGSMAIGGTVSGATSGQILYTNASGNLAQSTTLFYDATNIAQGINVASAPTADFHVLHNESGTLGAGVLLQRSVASSASNYFDIYKTRGSFASPAGPSASDTLGVIRFRSYNGTVPQTVGTIYARVTGTPSTTNLPGEIGFQTNTSATPSVLTTAALLDNTQTFNIKHAVLGIATQASLSDGNAQYSLAEVFGTEPNLPYAGSLMINDNSGVSATNGGTINFGVEFNSNSYTGGAMLKGYKANATAGDYGAGLIFKTRTNGSSQTEVMRVNEQQHLLVGLTADSSVGVFQVNGASWFADSMTLKNVRTGTTSDSVLVGGRLSNGKFVIHKVAQAGIGLTTLQQAITNGSTLSSSNTITNTGNTLTFTGGTFNFTGNGFTNNGGQYNSTAGSQFLGQASTINNPVTAASGTVSNFSAYYFGPPTVTSTNTSITYTNPSTVTISGPPAMSTNSTASGISYALNVQSGATNLVGNVGVGNIGGTSSTPSNSAGTGAGTSPTITVTGTDVGGLVQVTTGTAPAGSGAGVVTVTYAAANFANGSFVTLTPANAGTAALNGTTQVFVIATGTAFTITSGTLALSGSTTYSWYYHVIGKN